MFYRILFYLTLLSTIGVAQQKKVLVQGLNESAVRELQSAEPRARVVTVTEQNLMQQVADADAILGTISPELVRAGKKLRLFQTYSTGVERYLVETPSHELRDSPITVTNCKIIQGPEIADHAFAMLLDPH
jgi:phosphoglycerate dehydrogenase-like enzyme